MVLLPLEVMVKPLELGFKYHFEGDKPSNRTDKVNHPVSDVISLLTEQPELFFSHIVRLLNTHDGFFATYLQPVLRKHFQHSNLALTSIYIDSTSAFITALLPLLRRKVFAFLPQVAKQPHLLSHFIHELINFDVTITDEWGYDGGNSVEGWRGLAWEVLVKHSWFGAWLDVEKNCRHFVFSRHSNKQFANTLQLLYLATKLLSTKRRVEKSITIVLIPLLPNPQAPPFELTICSKRLQIVTDLSRPSPRNCAF